MLRRGVCAFRAESGGGGDPGSAPPPLPQVCDACDPNAVEGNDQCDQNYSDCVDEGGRGSTDGCPTIRDACKRRVETQRINCHLDCQ